MKKDFEEEKQRYLQQIEEDHNPPDDGYSFLRFRIYTYTPSAKFIGDRDFTSETIKELDIRNSTGGCYLALMVHLIILVMGVVWQPKQWWETIAWTIITFAMILSFTGKFKYKPGEKIHLRLTIHGMWIAKRDYVVKWNHLAWSGIRHNSNSDDYPDYLLLYYYDDRSDEWMKFEIERSKLCINNAELFFYMEYFKKMSEDHQHEVSIERKLL